MKERKSAFNSSKLESFEIRRAWICDEQTKGCAWADVRGKDLLLACFPHGMKVGKGRLSEQSGIRDGRE